VKTRYHIRDIAWKIIELQIEELKEFDVMKDQFIDVTSHEMRTPLTVIWGNIELLKRDEKESKMTIQQRTQIYEVIERNYKRILRLLREVFDVSRIRRELFELDLRESELQVVVKNTVEDMKKHVDKKGLDIRIDKTENFVTNNVLMDPIRINQVLRNLIENAIKYTEKGKIIVAIKNVQTDYVVSVKDEGIGIEKNEVEKIFSQFRYKKGSSLRKTGLGLGLFISKTIIDLHQGKIWVESEGKGNGWTFFFSIPK
jgi:signal transduction histidine kinase